jgi:hypothetical protein
MDIRNASCIDCNPYAFALCLLGAMFDHFAVIVQHRLLWEYGYGSAISPVSKVCWDTLMVLDPLAAVFYLSNHERVCGYLIALFKGLPRRHTGDDHEVLLAWEMAAKPSV